MITQICGGYFLTASYARPSQPRALWMAEASSSSKKNHPAPDMPETASTLESFFADSRMSGVMEANLIMMDVGDFMARERGSAAKIAPSPQRPQYPTIAPF